ncbi:MarR family transcriptional regulator [Streptomyces sp. NPDC046866]|uniref:MarR family transcriptional regulator n=1 Tax=Streptomyces sp. NPDC046866 TaxID=3154921 RepID=UPI0034518FB3
MKPIGHWLHRTDRALTRSMDEMLGPFGLTRIAWQVLNVVQDASDGAGDSEVRAVLAAHAEAAVLDAALRSVLADGWADRPAPGRLALTSRGRQRLGEAALRVEAFREQCTAGISPQEYRTAVHVLERMTRNLEASPSPIPRPSSRP